jgi:hypothetical protein
MQFDARACIGLGSKAVGSAGDRWPPPECPPPEPQPSQGECLTSTEQRTLDCTRAHHQGKRDQNRHVIPDDDDSHDRRTIPKDFRADPWCHKS